VSVTAQEWSGLAGRTGRLSEEERTKLLFNSFQMGHLSAGSIMELLDLGCDGCGKVLRPEEAHTDEDCVVWRVMES
jgi:hypothetical protein